MKLDRNINPDGKGKYRLWDERKQAWVDDCGPGQEHEYFVLMLKDVNSTGALREYAANIHLDDAEFAAEVNDLADRAGVNSPFCKAPD